MAVVNEVITYEQAFARGYPVWELQFQDWGYNSGSGLVSVYPQNGANTKGLKSVYGVSIGPRSIVDRSFLLFDPQVIVDETSLSPPDFLRAFNRRAPLMFSQLGSNPDAKSRASSVLAPITALRVGASPSALGVTGVSRPTVVTNSNFIPEGSAVAIALVPVDRPLLQVVFYLTAPVIGPPTARYVYDGETTRVFTGAETETYIGSFPVMGRDRISIILELTSASPQAQMTYRIAGHRCSITAPREVTLNATVNVNPNNPDIVKISDPGVDWINVWGAPLVTSPPTAMTAAIRLRAEDL